MTTNFSGKRAIVTGAASGIGQETALQLAGRGAEVIAVDAAQIDDPENRFAATCQIDLADPAQIASFVAATSGVDLLVNAAGVFIVKQISDVTVDDWNKTMDVNARAIFLLIQGLSPTMNDGASIVNVASIGGKSSQSLVGLAYHASKAAVMALSRTFAFALAPRGIRVNAVCPGTTDTPMLRQIFRDENQQTGESVESMVSDYEKRIPLGRLARTDDIARAIMFLLGPDAAYMTGQSVNVSGGLITY